ncbi:ABC transporter permease subunit [Pararoseomonas sp. SCSIO 73927]|uniref:amino acid ABC transporter permease n=1 Tax=Pararoseomonas sp. SCSIO 73927 TaxID=3114537 RepID=UPI0030CBF832
MADFAEAFLNPDILSEAWWLLAMGVGRTIALSLLVVPIGLAAGLGLALLCRRGRTIRLGTALFVDLFRALPPLVLLILLYAGLPFAGINLGPWGSVAACFLLNSGAYYCEVFRAGLKGVPRGQEDAAAALGLRPTQAMRLVLLPQAIRLVLPDLVSNTLEVVKLTSIASVVGVAELLFQARQAQSITYNATPIVAAALTYFILLWPLVRVLSHLEEARLRSAR